jgi:uncharacterized protein (TIGR00645 family)
MLYAVKFSVGVFHTSSQFLSLSENDMILAVLVLIDMTMIGNLLKTIITGSYYAFVEKEGDPGEKISSGYLKVKMSMSLVGISSIHLLQAFIGSETLSNREIYLRCGIHMIFLLGTLMMAMVEYLHEKSKTFAEGEH